MNLTKHKEQKELHFWFRFEQKYLIKDALEELTFKWIIIRGMNLQDLQNCEHEVSDNTWKILTNFFISLKAAWRLKIFVMLLALALTNLVLDISKLVTNLAKPSLGWPGH